MGGRVLLGLAAMVVVTSACEEPNTTDYDPVGAAARGAGMTLVSVPADQVESCVEWTKHQAYLGDSEATERWNAAGQSDDELEDVCERIGADDPEALAVMHWNWTAAESSPSSTDP